MKTSNLPQLMLIMPRVYWSKVSLMILGMIDHQVNDGVRVFTYTELMQLYAIGGRLAGCMVYRPEHALSMWTVLLNTADRAIVLKVIRKYEDKLLADREKIESVMGVNELLSRYDLLTKITRAVQTARPIDGDQHDR